MRSYSVLFIIAIAILATNNNYYYNQVRCDQLSSVFVLESADSSPQPQASSLLSPTPKEQRSVLDDSNTKIITDDAQQQQNPPLSSSNVNYNKSQRPQDPIRRVEDRTPPTNRNINNQQASSTSGGVQQPANQPYRRSTTSSTTSTTTADPYNNNRDYDSKPSSSSAATSNNSKEENRLLISISSDNDDYKPVIKQPISGSQSSISVTSGHDDASAQSSNSKPIFTISFQDANVNKGSVIVRPSDNGQSIVISTVNSVSNSNLKPQYLGGHNNDDRPPIRDPNLDSHNQNPYQNHHISSTTYRPPIANLNNDYTNRPPIGNNDYRPPVNDYRPPTNNQNQNDNYNNPNINRPPNRPPLVSTLLDPPTPNRPPIDNDNYNQQRPTNSNLDNQPSLPNRPIRPPSNDVLLPSSTSSSGYSNIGQPEREPIQTASAEGGSGNSKYPLNEKNCGLMEGTRIVGGEEVGHDEFLWMAAMIRSKSTNGEAKPFCGGSLITRRHILTAAHCLDSLSPRDILVRLGSYDFDDATASSTSGDYAIDQFRVPANYSKKTHVSDIAIMRLKTPLSPSDNYKTVCMPQARRSYVGALGTVIGYGSQAQTFRKAAPKLRQVTVPIWENRKCGVVYKKNLTDSFLCAGYEEGGKDACQGDSGGPLMTVGPNERMMVAGVVSHGIGCGSPEYPGVYTRVTTFLEWIEKNTRD